MENFEARFNGLGRLFSPVGLDRLRHAHVAVIGLGGVGSWAVESLARSGLGRLTLIDLDDVCVGNVNRQLHAVEGQFGKPKVDVLAARVKAINPDCEVRPIHAFFLPSNAGDILAEKFDYVVDAIDSPSRKCLMIAECRARSIPIITTGASAGRQDPTQIRVTDLALSSHDRLLQEVRKKLRVRHGFPRGGEPFGVECVYSDEPPIVPPRHIEVCVSAGADEPAEEPDLRLDCATGFGTASFVTGAFGLVAASRVVRSIGARHEAA